MPMIGLTGYAGAGKDEFATGLAEVGYERIGFADPMYEIAYIMNPIFFLYGVPFTYRFLVGVLGLNKAKRIPKVRRYLQRLGTEAGRNIFGDDIWISLMRPRVDKYSDVVITNVRFTDEAQYILDEGGVIVRIHRPGVGPVNEHRSDSGECFPFASIVVVNDGSREELWAKAVQLGESLREPNGQQQR